MVIQLSPVEARLLGALVEKEITTPDQYPLSLNGLTSACNQKTNREPVMELTESVIQRTLDNLGRRHLVLERSGFGSRVLKYRHRLCNGDHNPLQLSPQELAVICELLLRGPQTPGELRTRAQRLAPFADIGDVEATLARLVGREDGPFVTKLARQPGSREARYAQLFTELPEQASADESAEPEPAEAGREPGIGARVAALEATVARLTEEIQNLKVHLPSEAAPGGGSLSRS